MKIRNLLSAALAVLMVIAAVPGLAMANPWTETDEEGMMASLGIRIGVPESAYDPVLRMLESEGLGEAQFIFRGAEYTMRIGPAACFEDISGLHYEAWAGEENCAVRYCEGEFRQISDGEETIASCLWYDAAPGLMYSLTARIPEGETADVIALANVLFEPVQEDADGTVRVTALEAFDLLESCTGYEGTAGMSLKQAMAACRLISFAAEYDRTGADTGHMKECFSVASVLLTEEGICELIGACTLADTVFEDYPSVQGLFENAGVGEQMSVLLEREDTERMWKALKSVIPAENSNSPAGE